MARAAALWLVAPEGGKCLVRLRILPPGAAEYAGLEAPSGRLVASSAETLRRGRCGLRLDSGLRGQAALASFELRIRALEGNGYLTGHLPR